MAVWCLPIFMLMTLFSWNCKDSWWMALFQVDMQQTRHLCSSKTGIRCSSRQQKSWKFNVQAPHGCQDKKMNSEKDSLQDAKVSCLAPSSLWCKKNRKHGHQGMVWICFATAGDIKKYPSVWGASPLEKDILEKMLYLKPVFLLAGVKTNIRTRECGSKMTKMHKQKWTYRKKNDKVVPQK